MAIKSLGLDLSAISPAYQQKTPLKERSYLFPVLLEENPLTISLVVNAAKVVFPPYIDEVFTTVNQKVLSIELEETIFYSRKDEEEEQIIAVSHKPLEIELEETIFYKTSKQEEEQVLTVSHKPLEIHLEDTVFYIQNQQEEEQVLSVSHKPLEITLENI